MLLKLPAVPILYRVILGADSLAVKMSSWDVREYILHVGRKGLLQIIACCSHSKEESEEQKEIKRNLGNKKTQTQQS